MNALFLWMLFSFRRRYPEMFDGAAALASIEAVIAEEGGEYLAQP